MHHVLTEIVVVMAVAVVTAIALRRLRVPPVVGFILAGALIGPSGLALVSDRHTVELVAEIGVMLLLFMVGLKIPLRDLWRMRATVLGGGSLQFGATALVAAWLLARWGVPWREAGAWGLAVGLSSTALVLWLLEDRGETASSVGRTTIGVLLFQDLAVIPVILALPLLAGRAGSAEAVALVAGESLAVLAGVIVAARVVVPWLCARAVATRSRELFTLTVVLIALGTAVVLGHFGISMALGAFIAGMVVSESEYVAQIAADVTPLRDVFNSLFFVSIGMLVDLDVWLDHPLLAGGLVLAVVLGKAVLAGLALLPATGSLGTSLAAGLSLAQIGELAIVVAGEGSRLGLLDGGRWALFLAVTVPTMVVTPAVMAAARPLAGRLEARRRGGPAAALDGGGPGLRDHVVVVGFGVVGRSVARALSGLGVPHLVVDLNPGAVTEVAEGGGRALYGDGQRDAVLAAAGVERARAVIVAIPDAAGTRAVVAAVRRRSQEVTLLARTRYVREVGALEGLGADQVIPEELETAVELTGRVLKLYGASSAAVLAETRTLQAAHYGALRGTSGAISAPTLEALLSAAELEAVTIGATSEAVGRTLREVRLRERTGATVVAVDRGGDLRPNPSPDLQLSGGDALVLYGRADAIERARGVLGGGPAEVTAGGKPEG